MSDPSIEAAQRAWDATAEMTAGGYVVNPYRVAKTAAREMAKSVQELHKRTAYVDYKDMSRFFECASCGSEWPCETAKRVYPSEELGL